MTATASRNPSMAARIARVLPGLTRSHRQVADWVLAHPLQAATMPIDELAATVGVSVATANRFARALEFEGYAQFRAALVMGFETTLAPVEKLRSKLARPRSAAEVLAASLSEVARNVERTRLALENEACEKAVEAILKAQRIYVAGFGASSWLGGLLQRGLDPYCHHVQLLATPEGASYGAKIVAHARPSDLLIAIAFPRYLTDTVLLARRARDSGVPVLALTDRVTSPLAPLGAITLYAQVDSHYFASSEASALPLIEGLCSAVAHRAKGSVRKATALAESVMPWLHGAGASAARAAPARRKSQSSPALSKGSK